MLWDLTQSAARLVQVPRCHLSLWAFPDYWKIAMSEARGSKKEPPTVEKQPHP